MSVRNLPFLAESQDFLVEPAGNHRLLIQQNSLKLVAWTISGKAYRQKEYQKGCNPYYKILRTSSFNNFKSAGANGLALIVE